MQETIRTMSRNHSSNWEILSHLMAEGMSHRAAVKAIAAALRLPADEVADMLDSFENNV
jgi:uncharacterized protein YoaH (UPF0181 family)